MAFKEELLSLKILKKRAEILRQPMEMLEEFDENLSQHPHLLFQICQENFLLPLEDLKKIIAHPKVTNIPSTPPYFAGVMNLRGLILEVLHLDRLFHLQNLSIRNEAEDKQHLLVCEIDGEFLGLWIDQVVDLISCSPESWEEIPDSVTPLMRNYLSGTSRYDSEKRKIASIINLRQIFFSLVPEE